MKVTRNRMIFFRLALIGIVSGLVGLVGCVEPTFSVPPAPAPAPAPAPVVLTPKIPIPAPAPTGPLVWDADRKEASPKVGQMSADFTFTATNTADTEVIINQALGSCSCTVAKLPSQPWHLAPHSTGTINVSVNLSGKVGTFSKTVTVLMASNIPPKVLTVSVAMPENPQMTRARNMQIAATDRQAVFKGECAKCHAEPAKDAAGHEVAGKALYKAVCDNCHEGHNGIQRASMVPDLHALNHPTDYNFWKDMIANGKPGTLMPAFSSKHGGPLTDAQIDSLAKVLVTAMPYRPGATNQPGTQLSPKPFNRQAFPPTTPKI